MNDIILNLSSKIEPHFPIWNSCSYLGRNYHDEISNQFEDFLSDALIPESSCLLIDTRYPLQGTDDFYKTPWINAEREEFFNKESKKIEEYLSDICGSSNAWEQVIDVPSVDSIETVDQYNNFVELNLQDIRSSIQGGVASASVEEPYISNSILLKNKSLSIEALLKKLPLMELENPFKNETSITFDISNFFDQYPMTDVNDFLPENDDNFEKLDLTDVRPKCINLQVAPSIDFSQPYVDSGFISNDGKDNVTMKNFGKVKENVTLIKPHDLYITSPVQSSSEKRKTDLADIVFNLDEDFFEEDSLLHLENNYAFEQDSNDALCNISNAKHSELNSHLKLSDQNILTFDDVCPEEVLPESSVNPCDLNLAESRNMFKVHKNSYLSSESKKENIFIADSHFQNFENSEIAVSTDNSLISNNNSFLNKLSDININKMLKQEPGLAAKDSCLKLSVSRSVTSEENSQNKNSNFDQTNLAIRNHISKDCNSKNLDKNIEISENISNSITNYKSQSSYFCNENIKEKISLSSPEYLMQNYNQMPNMSSFNLLSSLLVTRKRGAADDVRKSQPKYFHHEPLGIKLKSCSNQMIETCKTSSSRNISFPMSPKELISDLTTSQDLEQKQLLSSGSIDVKFSDEYVDLILAHETAATYFMQKLLCYQDFQVSQDLTLIDLSLDRLAFLINQEEKSCRDRHLNPLKGGVQYSYYVQLLVLHGILKSLLYFVHFGAELSLSVIKDFTQSSQNSVKECFSELLQKVKSFIPKTSDLNLVHPKLKYLGLYLEEKYYFCKDNFIEFKVLIILKQCLSFFFPRFKHFMKTLLPEIAIELIPESHFLQKNSDIFSISCDFMCIVNAASLLKNLPWSFFTLVIEYECDNNATWQNICAEKNLAYVSMKLDSLPLKTLKEINKLSPVKAFFEKNSEKHILVISSPILSEYNAKSTLNALKDVLIYERSYEMNFPDLHFADVAVDHKTCIIILNMMSFLNDDYSKLLNDKMSYLQLKYELCWIIVEGSSSMHQNKSFSLKIQGRFNLFLLEMNFYSSKFLKIKFLYAKSSTDVLKWIIQIVTKSFHKRQSDVYVFPESSLPDYMSTEESFLLSFPSLNPIVVSFLLSSKNPLADLMTMKLEELYDKFPYIPNRFLKHFHCAIHENPNASSVKSKKECHSKEDSFQLSPEISTIKENNPFCMELCANINEDCDMRSPKSDSSLENNFPSSLLKKPRFSAPSPSFGYSDMSVEDIDRNYQELCLEDIDMFSDITSDKFENSDSSNVSSDQATIMNSPKDQSFSKLLAEEETLSFREASSLHPSTKNKKESTHFKPAYSPPPKINREPLLSRHKNNQKPKPRVSFSLEGDSPPRKSKDLNFSQFVYQKRKSAGESPQSTKRRKFSPGNASPLYRSFKIQKGQSSKTVCKDSFNPGECMIVENSPDDSLSLIARPQFERKTFQMAGSHTKSDSPLHTLGSPRLAQQKVLLAPKQSHKLSFEKIPGSKGQTRLVFQ